MPRTNGALPTNHTDRNRDGARRRALATATVTLTLAFAGCGTDFGSLLYTSFQAAGRAALDQALTDLAGSLTAGGSTTDTTGGGTDTTGGGTDTGGTGTGSSAGETLFANDGCTACHCADASGGCALSAPSLVGVDAAVLAGIASGASTHPIGVSLTDQEQADLIAWLASLP